MPDFVGLLQLEFSDHLCPCKWHAWQKRNCHVTGRLWHYALYLTCVTVLYLTHMSLWIYYWYLFLIWGKKNPITKETWQWHEGMQINTMKMTLGLILYLEHTCSMYFFISVTLHSTVSTCVDNVMFPSGEAWNSVKQHVGETTCTAPEVIIPWSQPAPCTHVLQSVNSTNSGTHSCSLR